jgi:hypothetical protein
MRLYELILPITYPHTGRLFQLLETLGGMARPCTLEPELPGRVPQTEGQGICLQVEKRLFFQCVLPSKGH